ncbi:MAG: RNA-binding transcriptional accessory protein [Bacteroidetes bacterium]|nr:MAG: RNA-binding transcriptional accessory protein [Bacteroidota bacterium]
MKTSYVQQIAENLAVNVRQITNIASLHEEGATIPFMARYRKEATGNLDEVKIASVIENLQYFSELDKRKETVFKTIEAAGKLSPELKGRIENCLDAAVLEDIYLPFKPKRKTRATVALEKGLEPLARSIFEQGSGIPANEAIAFLNDKVGTAAEALQGSRDIIAEWIAENQDARKLIRQYFEERAVLHSKVLTSKKDEEDAQKYRDYFEYSEPLATSPSHRMLAVRRGEKEGFLSLDITIDKLEAVSKLEKTFIKSGNEKSQEVKIAIADGYERLLKPSIETEFRLVSKNKADEEAIRVFAENLRQLLLAAPLGSKRVMAIDPGFRTGCKIVCLDAQGNFLINKTIYPHPPQSEWTASEQVLRECVDKYKIEAIAIGNGTAGRETEQLVRGIRFTSQPAIFVVSESGASIYSASELAREEFPDQDVTVRGAISIGRRLLDPLSELVKIDAKSIGVGQYQHDVNQNKLKEELDRTVESCVNHVGVDLNTASRHLLMYVSGLSANLARNIVDYRSAHGPFQTREILRKVPQMGPKSFEQSAGFLRIPQASNPLDNSAVHPESYPIVSAMAADLKCSVGDLISDAALRGRVDYKKYVTEQSGEFTIKDILKELEKPGRDPRDQAIEFRFDENIRSIEDVKVGMKIPGIVTNITNFGAFVDIGVKQDGLVHISELSNEFVSDPSSVVKLQQQVVVTVTDVDVQRKRIALSMREAGKEGQRKSQAPVKKDKSSVPSKPAPQNAFQSKLMELKKKFND